MDFSYRYSAFIGWLWNHKFGAGNGFFGRIGGIASEANYSNASRRSSVLGIPDFPRQSSVLPANCFPKGSKRTKFHRPVYSLKPCAYPISGSLDLGRRAHQSDGLMISRRLLAVHGRCGRLYRCRHSGSLVSENIPKVENQKQFQVIT